MIDNFLKNYDEYEKVGRAYILKKRGNEAFESFYLDSYGGNSLDNNENDLISKTLSDERSRKTVENLKDIKGAVLDLGTGQGFLSGALKRINDKIKVVGYDISPKACMKSVENDFVDYSVQGSDSLPFRDSIFDGVIMGDLIEHLLMPETFLEEIFRVLKDGGALSLSTPNVSFLDNRLKMLKGEFPKTECNKDVEVWNAQHIRFFNFYTIRSILEKKGFSVEKIEGVRFMKSYKIRRPIKKIFKYLPDNLTHQMMVAKAFKKNEKQYY
ncbi:hypothetical protein C0584_01765 [Candidatus Parcubacteria bacterium]|nr:MAG: hypothetical protein C0584_01765 [Candidatus Parcubacteria bacterium]